MISSIADRYREHHLSPLTVMAVPTYSSINYATSHLSYKLPAASFIDDTTKHNASLLGRNLKPNPNAISKAQRINDSPHPLSELPQELISHHHHNIMTKPIPRALHRKAFILGWENIRRTRYSPTPCLVKRRPKMPENWKPLYFTVGFAVCCRIVDC